MRDGVDVSGGVEDAVVVCSVRRMGRSSERDIEGIMPGLLPEGFAECCSLLVLLLVLLIVLGSFCYDCARARLVLFWNVGKASRCVYLEMLLNDCESDIV